MKRASTSEVSTTIGWVRRALESFVNVLAMNQPSGYYKQSQGDRVQRLQAGLCTRLVGRIEFAQWRVVHDISSCHRDQPRCEP
jgi:hypothetical protein